MRVERRKWMDGTEGVVLVTEDEMESFMLDTLGKTVGEDGLIALLEGELRLADGYGEHYIVLKAKEGAACQQTSRH